MDEFENALESVYRVTEFCDNLGITLEADVMNKITKKKVDVMVRSTKTSPGLMAQLIGQKKQCETRYKKAKEANDYTEFKAWLEKSKAGIQRKINGTEIGNKAMLQKFINLYDSYLNKCH